MGQRYGQLNLISGRFILIVTLYSLLTGVSGTKSLPSESLTVTFSSKTVMKKDWFTVTRKIKYLKKIVSYI